jgi:ribosomal protein S3
MLTLTPKEKTLLPKIGEYFYKECGEDLEATKALLYSLHIKQIIVVGGYGNSPERCLIVTGRPGLLIGRRATRIEALKKFLGIEIEIREYEGPELEQYMLAGILHD